MNEATSLICPNNCRDPQGRTIYMTTYPPKWDILSKKERPTIQCNVCRRWVFRE
jgi:hypothetical protein